MSGSAENKDSRVVDGFGDEWSRFTQAQLPPEERERIFQDYFAIFPWDKLPKGAEGLDVGCGSGRWALVAAPRVGRLHVLDASPDALAVARSNLKGLPNVTFHQASVDAIPHADGSLDFAYSLGVLHHVPDTPAAIRAVAAKLKPGAPLLLYLYYAFDNRPLWFRLLWRASDLLRRVVCRLPMGLRYLASQLIAGLVYWPLARTALLLDKLKLLSRAWPLAYYRDKTFYTLRTDALDRFGTRLEQRFTRKQMAALMEQAGLEQIRFSPNPPYWCAVAIKSA